MSAKTEIKKKEGGFDVRLILRKFISYWYLFAFSIIVSYFAPRIYLRYQEPIYSVYSSVLIESNTSSSSKNLGGLDMFNERKNVYNEIGLIKSFDLVDKAISKLDFAVSYYHVGKIRTIELYNDVPFLVVLDSTSYQLQNIPIFINILPGNKFRLHAEVKGAGIYDFVNNVEIGRSGNYNVNMEHSFGKPIKHKDFSFTIYLQTPAYTNNSDQLYFTINNRETLAKIYLSKINVTPYNKYASILTVSTTGPVVKKEIDFINKLCQVYIQNGLDQKNKIATNTVQFINDQLKQVSESLKETEKEMENFKSVNKHSDIATGTGENRIILRLEDLEKLRTETEVKKRYYNYLLEYIQNNKDLSQVVAPSSLGIEDGILTELLNKLLEMKAKRNSITSKAGAQNPFLINLDQQIKYTKESILESLHNITEIVNADLRDLNHKISKSEGDLSLLPKNESRFLDIQRRFTLNDHLYNFLLEKRAEAQITKASNKADGSVVEEARLVNANLISPNTGSINNFSYIIGLILPVLFILGKEYFNEKVRNKEDVESRTNIPILGIVGHNNLNSNLPVYLKPKGPIAEALRAIRFNLGFFSQGLDKKIIITVNSSISGEGKTFFAMNLSSILALSDKRVLLIGADLRKPKIFNDFNLDNSIGLSSYLGGKSTLAEAIRKTDIPNIDLITSGPIPPNPAELLESKLMSDLLSNLKDKYDYIIIDTPPIGIVSDGFALTKYSDINIFIIRQEYTSHKMIEKIDSLYREEKIKNVSIVINDVKKSDTYSYGYGYEYGYGKGYGYYEEEEKASLFSRLMQLKNKSK
jgi:tyrosine-protein kinase Etk/Wzc